MNLHEASREVMWNIHTYAWAMYLTFVIAMGIFGYGVWRRVSFWRSGKPAQERWTQFGKRAVFLIKEILLQKKTREEAFPGWFHSLIFYSFLALIATTAVVAFDYDVTSNIFKVDNFFFHGWLYLMLSLAAEIGGVLIVVGIGMAAWRRYVKKPSHISTMFDDSWALVLIGLMILTGYLVEGLRIAVVGDKWAWISPVGYTFSKIFAGISPEGGKAVHFGLWWTHTLLAMGWIATIPYTKFFHLLSLPTNVFFRKMEERGMLRRQDLEAMMTAEDFDESKFNFGTERTGDFTWKELMDFDACISCGRCEQICPSAQAGQPFSPKKLIASLKELAHKDNEARLAKGKAAKANGNGHAAEGAPAAAEAAEGGGDEINHQIIGAAFAEDYLWFCRTCMACMEVCPAMIDHVDTIINVRRNEAVMQGRMPADAARAMRLLETQGNPFGPEDTRHDWIKELKVRVVNPGETVDVIYWIGCCTTFDPAKQKIAADLCRLLDRCGIDFGVLGADERCCGDPARLIGQEHLFQTIAKMQVEALNSRTFRVLIVSCPHCYNVLKNEYPQFGGKYNVVHHSEFLHEMLWSGSLIPMNGEKRKIVYHDPCYLGRYQKIYDSPREVLKAVPGAEMLEMKDHASRSQCCGGGGGNYWFDVHVGERLNNRRVKQAHEAGADTIVTGCAYCMQMLDDSVKLMDLAEQIEVIDLATLIHNSL